MGITTIEEVIKEAKLKYGRSGLRKIKNTKLPCMSPEHNPPTHIYLEAGTYEYVCPSCGHRTVFEVPLITC